MARYLVVVLCLLGLTLSTPSRADSVSCIVFGNYYSPYWTYKIVHTSNKFQCCNLCADDNRCVAWTRDTKTGRCALKDNVDFLVAGLDVDSGIKYRGAGAPQLVDNSVGATVLSVKAESQPVPHSSGGGTTAFASVSSTGGRSSATVTATPGGVTSRSSVSGSGSAVTSASNPSVSLSTSVTKKEGERANVAVSYYKHPVILGEVVTVKNKKILIVGAKDGITHCYTCPEYPCLYTRGESFKKNGVKIAEFDAASNEECCRACRANPQCVSWWRSAKKRCVLNSNFPGRTSTATHVGGLYL